MHKSNNPDVEWRIVGVNLDKPEKWKSDIAESVDFYNSWFLRFAPKAYRDTRVKTTKDVISALTKTANLTSLEPSVLRQNPSILPMLRMATAPPIARDRLIGLAQVSRSLVNEMETKRRIPPKMRQNEVDDQLRSIGEVVMKLADLDLFPWLGQGNPPTEKEVVRAATVVADRLCGAMTDPIIKTNRREDNLVQLVLGLMRRDTL